VKAVANSIKTYGFRQPIVVDKDGVIVVGHTRWKAAKHLGMTEVHVHVAHDLTPEQARAYRVADNKLNEIAEWDCELLPLELAELKGLGVDLDLLGFNAGELAEIMAPQGNPGVTDPDDVPAPPDAATTKPGDLWVLGNHRLLCGDSASASDLDRLMDGQRVHLLNTESFTGKKATRVDAEGNTASGLPRTPATEKTPARSGAGARAERSAA
jgi:hypothetical protein